MTTVPRPYTKRQKLSDRRIQKAALRPFWTALAKRETTPVDVLCLGDSLTEGAYVSTIEKRWVARFRDKLRIAYPTASVIGGQGYICANYHTIGPGNPGVEINQVMTQTGGSTDAGYVFGLGRRYRKLTTAGDKLAVTVTCSSFDVLCTSGSGRGVMGVKIDGGAVANVDTSNAFAWSGRHYASGALTPGSHAVEISYVSGGEIDVEGIMVYNGDETSGIRLFEAGHGGVKSDFYNGGSWLTIPGGRGTLYSAAPHLVVIELGVNDLLFNTGSDWPSSLTAGRIQTLIANMRTACSVAAVPTTPSFLLVILHQVTGSYVEPWANYVAALWSVALADPTVAVLDFNDLFGPATTASGLFATDLIHLNDVGGEFYANAIMGAIAP